MKKFFFAIILSIKLEFGDVFIRFQKWLFEIFIAGEILSILIQGIAQGWTIKDIFSLIINIFIIWLLLSVSTTLCWWLGKRIFDLDLLFEYYVWIPFVFKTPNLGNLLYKEEEIRLLELVWRSYPYEKKGKRSCPVLIKRAHLERKRFWPHWEFSIVLINQPGKITVNVRKSRTNQREKRWELVVDLLNESYGIYNNAGKKFMRDNYSNDQALKTMKSASKQFYDILSPETELGTYIRWAEKNERLPLRWASGGFLPIIKYKNKEWAMFFFRDILPIGLNIANGASEKKDEYKDLNCLIGREFAEEVVLLTGMPSSGSRISQQRFTHDEFSPSSAKSICEYIHPEFSKHHNLLRKEHDNIDIQLLDDEEGRQLSTLINPFRVRVKYHSKDPKTSEEGRYNKNVMFLINPFEFGIEAVWLCKFELEEDEYILDGEYDLGRNYLVRQPVIMIGMDFLENLYQREKSLGTTIDGGEGKLLPVIQKGEFVIFAQDIELLRKRLTTIRNKLATMISLKDRENLIYEENRINKWLIDYSEAFEKARTGNLEHPQLRTLCPVSWKTLELIFAHRLYQKN